MGNLLMQGQTYVNNAVHLLHHAGHLFPCDREIEALQTWRGQALLLSSDTDCLSLFDAQGLLRLTRVGVYPQDMAVRENTAYICGGADGRVHLLDLPSLQEKAAFPLPGLVERIALHQQTVYLLTLLPEEPVCTALLSCPLTTMQPAELRRFAGIPGALATDNSGLWVGVSEQLLHLPHGEDTPDMVIEGFGLPRRIIPIHGGALALDELENRLVQCTHQGVTLLDSMEKGARLATGAPG